MEAGWSMDCRRGTGRLTATGRAADGPAEGRRSGSRSCGRVNERAGWMASGCVNGMADVQMGGRAIIKEKRIIVVADVALTMTR